MKDNINPQLAVEYLKLSRAPKKTSVHYKVSQTERSRIEQAAKEQGVSFSEAARFAAFIGLSQ